MTAVMVYRGPFQGRRIRFLLDTAHTLYGEVDLVWVNPGFDPATPARRLSGLREARPYLGTLLEVGGTRRSLLPTVRRLRQGWRSADVVIAVGFTALNYARALRPGRLVWAVNGIPEERVLHDPGPRTRAAAHAAWTLARVGRRPDAIVTVSDAMGRLVSGRLGGAPWAKAPTAVDVDTFGCTDPVERTHLTYVGSGAPWQAIDVLGTIWRAVHDLDPAARFRIVSRDPRTHAIANGLPDDSVEIVAGRSPAHVASLLWDTQLGFLVRRPDIVNTASFPTKFGEYVAAGVPVVSSDIGWEVGDIIRQTGCGMLIEPDQPAERTALDVVAFRDSLVSDDSAADGCRQATSELDRDLWIDRLSASLKELLR